MLRKPHFEKRVNGILMNEKDAKYLLKNGIIDLERLLCIEVWDGRFLTAG